MARRYTPKIVTANDLRDGHVVYLAPDGSWVCHHDQAELIEDEAIADLRLLSALGQSDRVVGPYLADARPGPAGPEPVHFRELFRATGPSAAAKGLRHV